MLYVLFKEEWCNLEMIFGRSIWQNVHILTIFLTMGLKKHFSVIDPKTPKKYTLVPKTQSFDIFWQESFFFSQNDKSEHHYPNWH